MARFPSMMQVSRVNIYLTYPFVLSWSLLEAMSAGAAIVASDTPPVKEAMVDGETGLFVEFFDHVGLFEKTCQLLHDEALREKKLGTDARKHIVDHYDLLRTCLPKHLERVDQLAKQPVLGPNQFIS
jgi:glycosyltransferase involved in cell wall biosynthesis